MVGILKEMNKRRRGVIFVIVLIVILLAGWGIYSLLAPPKQIQIPVESMKDEAAREQVAFISVVIPDNKEA